MDEYGTYRDCLEDYLKLASHIHSGHPITFTFSNDQESAYIVSICQTVNVGGPLPFGGKISGKHLVSVRRKGSEFFNLESETELHPNYVDEKLQLGHCGSEAMALLLNRIKSALKQLKHDLKGTPFE